MKYLNENSLTDEESIQNLTNGKNKCGVDEFIKKYDENDNFLCYVDNDNSTFYYIDHNKYD